MDDEAITNELPLNDETIKLALGNWKAVAASGQKRRTALLLMLAKG